MTRVYVIEAQERLVKIGIAGNPQSRLAQLRTGTPFPLRLAHVEDVKELTAARVERMAHHRLAAHRTHGEWFGVSVDEAVQAIRHVSEQMRNPPGLAALRAAYEAKASAFQISDVQLRVARVALNLGVRETAQLAEVSPFTIVQIEAGRPVKAVTMTKIRRALEAAGVDFVAEDASGGAGVRLRKA